MISISSSWKSFIQKNLGVTVFKSANSLAAHVLDIELNNHQSNEDNSFLNKEQIFIFQSINEILEKTKFGITMLSGPSSLNCLTFAHVAKRREQPSRTFENIGAPQQQNELEKKFGKLTAQDLNQKQISTGKNTG